MRGWSRSLVAASLVACTTLKAAEELDSGVPSGETPSTNDAAPGSSDAAAVDASVVAPADASTCTPSCAGRACGRDPTCDASCGACGAAETCDESSNGAVCRAPTIEWFVDGTRVAAKASSEAWYFGSSSTYSAAFPLSGRSVQINLSPGATTGTVTSCPSNNPSLSLITSDNSWAGLGALPDVWRNLIFTTCGTASSGDVVVGRTLTLTQLSPARMAGNYEVVVVGKGPREGSTLRVRGAFDVAPKNM